jgi:hypothetical protein
MNPTTIPPPVAPISTAGLRDAILAFSANTRNGFCEVQTRTIAYFAENVACQSFLDAAAASMAWHKAAKLLYKDTLDPKTLNSPYSMEGKQSEHTLAAVVFGTMPREFAEAVMRIHVISDTCKSWCKPMDRSSRRDPFFVKWWSR